MATIQELDQKYGLTSGGGAGMPTQSPQDPSQGLGQRFVNSPAIPRIESTLGGVGGLMGGPLVSTGLAGAGYAHGTYDQDMIQKLLRTLGVQGVAQPTPQEQMQHLTGGTGHALLNAGMANTGLMALRAFMDPFGTAKNAIGGLRSSFIGNRSVPTDELSQESSAKMTENPYFQASVPDSQAAANGAMSRFIGTVNPGDETGNVPINDVYSKLHSFDVANKAFGKNTDFPSATLAQGSNLASRGVRDYLSSQIGAPARLMNDVFGKISEAEKSRIAQVLPRLILGAGFYRGIPAIFKRLQQNQ